ncbi:MAG: response regulator [Phycisphaerae bacterium]
MLVEDDGVDAMTVKRAFKDLEIANPLVLTLNGEEALEYLKSEENKKPCIILLDLNMPRMNGLEFMQVVKADDKLKEIPIVVLTTSHENRDKAESFKLGVAGYMLKRINYKEFVEMVRAIILYWTLSELPDAE